MHENGFIGFNLLQKQVQKLVMIKGSLVFLFLFLFDWQFFYFSACILEMTSHLRGTSTFASKFRVYFQRWLEKNYTCYGGTIFRILLTHS